MRTRKNEVTSQYKISILESTMYNVNDEFKIKSKLLNLVRIFLFSELVLHRGLNTTLDFVFVKNKTITTRRSILKCLNEPTGAQNVSCKFVIVTA